ncbi:MAG: PA14 domain-containing protein, partial [Pseudomonadota bacterium]
YQVYDGNWNALPNFDALTPMASGTSDTIGLGVTSQVETFGLVFTHTLEVPAPTTYEFRTVSDDGSKLFIGDTLVVNNDGLHGPRGINGQIFLAPGTYDLRVEFFEKFGGQVLDVTYRPQNGDFAPIPADGQLASGERRFNYAVYDGTFDVLPDFSLMTPIATGESDVIGLGVTTQTETFGLVFTHTLVVPSDGTYEFRTVSDDGSKVIIDGNVVVNNDGLHGARARTGLVNLAAGTHSLRVEFFEKFGGQVLDVTYRPDGGTYAPLPATGELVEAVQVAALPAAPRHSATIIVESSTGADRVWNVNPDNASVSVTGAGGALIAQIPVGDRPWSLARRPGSNQVLVTSKGSATISVIDTGSFSVTQTVALPTASQPHGLAFNASGSEYFVVLEALAQVQKRSSASHAVLATATLTGTPRHVAMRYDDQSLLVSNFITPRVPGEDTASVDVNSGEAQVFVIEPSAMTLANTVTLTHDGRSLTESGGPGMPNYLHAPVIEFDDARAYVPSKKDNIASGATRGIPGMTFESAVRANASRINLGAQSEDSGFRVDFDNSSVASGAALTGNGRYLLVALETSRQLSVYDVRNNFELMRLPTGRAPQGVAVSSNGRIAYVHNFMDRSITRVDLTQI